MKKLNPRSMPLVIALLILLSISVYQTYALASLSYALSENGVSLGKASADYNFSVSAGAGLSELPDMAGGC